MARCLPTTLSIGAPSRSTAFIEVQTPNFETSLIFRVGTQGLNIFQDGSAGFKATIDKKKVLHGHVYSYVKNVDLISIRQEYDYKEHGGKKR
jgi:hypothetical protein